MQRYTILSIFSHLSTTFIGLNLFLLVICHIFASQNKENPLWEQRYIAGWSSWLACRAHNPEVGGSSPPPATQREIVKRLSLVFYCGRRTRSVGGVSGDLSACSGGGASLCDYDAKSRYRQVNKFPRQHLLFTSDLRPCTTTPPLGHLSTAATVRVQLQKRRLESGRNLITASKGY